MDGVVSVEESLSGAAEDLSARSSPSVDMQLQSQLHEETESAEGPGHEFGDSQLAGYVVYTLLSHLSSQPTSLFCAAQRDAGNF